MKANQIMVGDYLGCDASPWVKVVSIAEDGIFFQDEIGEGACSMDHLHGIPLTPEILENNGFRKSEDGFWPRYVFVADIEKCPQTVIDFSFYDENVSGHTLLTCWTRPQGCDGENNIHICDLKYVHQLQHALRLIGIQKDIEL